MTTTYRTAVGRRLTVRRRAHRPPGRGRKLGHRSILARLTATVAATVAVAGGIALARAGRERREAARRRLRERQFALLPSERPATGLRRIALGQLDLAIELLAANPSGPLSEHAVHELRKSLKRLRALIRLLEGQLPEPARAQQQELLRRAGRRLAGARDAEVLVGTLDALVARHPGQLSHRRGVARLRARLVAERQQAAAQALADARTRRQELAELWAVRARVAEWSFSEGEGIESVQLGLAEIYRGGRRRQRLAARAKGDRARALHLWRKRVKDLRYAAEMLDRFDAAAGARRGSGPLASLARRADELGELLGEEHDLVLLAGRIRSDGALGKRTRKALLKLIARRRSRLQRQALRRGERLYRRRTRNFLALLRRR
jgi:hypothetical protein